MEDNEVSIQDDIDEYIRHETDGFERIKKFYDEYEGDYSIQGDYPELDRPPHCFLAERAARLLQFQNTPDNSREIGNAYLNITDIALGIATELLLKSIILKRNPSWFIENTNENQHPPRTPPFSKISEEFMENQLPNSFNHNQIQRCEKILELIRARRNNSIHLDFHTKANYRQPYQILSFLEFLFTEYFRATDFENTNYERFIKMISRLKEGYEVETGIDYPEVDLLDY